MKSQRAVKRENIDLMLNQFLMKGGQIRKCEKGEGYGASDGVTVKYRTGSWTKERRKAK